jgi:hypothetical protein
MNKFWLIKWQKSFLNGKGSSEQIRKVYFSKFSPIISGVIPHDNVPSIQMGHQKD